MQYTALEPRDPLGDKRMGYFLRATQRSKAFTSQFTERTGMILRENRSSAWMNHWAMSQVSGRKVFLIHCNIIQWLPRGFAAAQRIHGYHEAKRIRLSVRCEGTKKRTRKNPRSTYDFVNMFVLLICLSFYNSKLQIHLRRRAVGSRQTVYSVTSLRFWKLLCAIMKADKTAKRAQRFPCFDRRLRGARESRRTRAGGSSGSAAS